MGPIEDPHPQVFHNSSGESIVSDLLIAARQPNVRFKRCPANKILVEQKGVLTSTVANSPRRRA